MTIWVLIIWLGTWNGGPAAIDGFTSKAACDQAAKAIASGVGFAWGSAPHYCFEIKK